MDSVGPEMNVRKRILQKLATTLNVLVQPALKDTKGFATIGLHLKTVNSGRNVDTFTRHLFYHREIGSNYEKSPYKG